MIEAATKCLAVKLLPSHKWGGGRARGILLVRYRFPKHQMLVHNNVTARAEWQYSSVSTYRKKLWVWSVSSAMCGKDSRQFLRLDVVNSLLMELVSFLLIQVISLCSMAMTVTYQGRPDCSNLPWSIIIVPLCPGSSIAGAAGTASHCYYFYCLMKLRSQTRQL